MTGDPHGAAGEPFRVLATCGVFEPGFRGGGPVRSIAQMVDNAPECVDLALVTSDRDLGSRDPYLGLSGRWVARSASRVFYLDSNSLRQWLRLWRDLRKTRFHLLYVNSLWAPIHSVIPIAAARLRLIHADWIIVAPRGELSPAALSIKARKKSLFLGWWGPLLRGMDVTWHASTEREASDIRAACPWANVIVSLNQTSLPAEPIATSTVIEGPARLVFIGRVSEMKNLALTLTALRALSTPVHFDIYGPLEDTKYWARCERLIDQLPDTVHVSYRGVLAPSEVRQTFAQYDAFVFPTRGENFGHVIAESLSASCPVVCSEETPWTTVLEAGGGTVIQELTSTALSKHLSVVASMTPSERLEAKQAAGNAYRTWRATTTDRSILEHAWRAWITDHRRP